MSEIIFECPENLRPHLDKVFAGEYDITFPYSGEGKRIIDLGANYGAFAVWASGRWPGSQISAYEPHPDVFSALQRNCAHLKGVTLNNVGVGSPGMRVLWDGVNNEGERSFYVMNYVHKGTGRHCEVVDPLSLPEADILKLDVEGAEIEILPPLIRAGRKYDLILLEYHSDWLRREIDRLLCDYILIGAEVAHICGRGTLKYIHRDIHREVFPCGY